MWSDNKRTLVFSNSSDTFRKNLKQKKQERDQQEEVMLACWHPDWRRGNVVLWWITLNTFVRTCRRPWSPAFLMCRETRRFCWCRLQRLNTNIETHHQWFCVSLQEVLKNCRNFLLLCERIILSDLAEASFTLLWYSNRNVFSCSKKSSTSWETDRNCKYGFRNPQNRCETTKLVLVFVTLTPATRTPSADFTTFLKKSSSFSFLFFPRTLSCHTGEVKGHTQQHGLNMEQVHNTLLTLLCSNQDLRRTEFSKCWNLTRDFKAFNPK